MVRRVNHDTDNSQRTLLTIQRPHDSKWREKQGEEGEERLRKQREVHRARRDRESEEEQQTILERCRYVAMNTEQWRNLTHKEEGDGRAWQ